MTPFPFPFTMSHQKVLDGAVNLMGVICILIGLFTMVMWKVHKIHLLFFTVTTMFFNTALCFVLIGAGLLFLGTRYFLIAKILGSIVVLFSIAVISQDIFSIELYVDEIFAEFYYHIPGVIPGRMAFQTSVNFILSGIALFILCDQQLSHLKILASLILSSLAFIIALVAIFGYFFHLAQSYGWLFINPIAINTAITFLFLTTGLILFAIQKSISLNIPISNYVHYILFVSIAVGAVLLWQAFTIQSRLTMRMITKIYAQDLLSNFERSIGSSIKRYDPALLRVGGEHFKVTKEAWEKYGKYLFEREEYVEYVGIFSEKLKPLLTYSPKSIEIPIHYLNSETLNQGISLSSPFISNTNERMYLIIYPFLSERVRKYIVRVINIDRLIQTTGALIYKDNMFLRIKKNGALFYKSPGVDLIDKTYFKELRSDKYKIKWDLAVWPTPAFLAKNRTYLPEITLFTGLFFAFFIAYAFRYALLSSRRARELDKAKVNLLIAHEIASLGGWVWDLKKDRITFTKQALRMLGLDIHQSTLPADEFFYLVHPNETENLKKAISAMRSGRSGYSEIYTFIRPDQEVRKIRFAAEVSAFENHYPVEISGIFQDLTKLKILEEELHQSQKMDLVGQLTGGIAHDFNNILTIIQGNLELLSFMLTEDSKEYKKIETALAACTRGAALTKRLLAFARRDMVHPEVVDLNTYMDNLAHLLSPTLGESIESSIEVSPKVGQIKVDPNQLESALLNLLVNSRDAMEERGTLKIKVENISSQHADLLKKEKIPYGSYIRISVIDSGVGMPPDVLEHVFEPFFTTKPPNKGTGLGLSMVKGFVEQSNGHLRLSSKVGKGTTVEMYFPSFIQERELKKELAKKPSEELRGHELILVVEDEEAVRSTAVEYLQSLGYTVLEAPNGDIAFEILKKNKNIDLLFTDIVMPGTMNGLHLAEKATKLLPHLKVLYTSGYPEKVRGNGQSLSPLIIKPYTLIDLSVTVKHVLHSSPSD